ncbi:MAG: FkbM family methyltransferase [Lachnospiraceae bacterium]|nr:FkbM family methyltransferase [Lachnospiraceae bacterium]
MSIDSIDKMLQIKNTENFSKDIWIWGTGNTAEMLQEGLKRWNRFGQVKGYLDSNPSRWGKTFYGKPIDNPAKMGNKDDVVVLICTNQLNFLGEIRELIEKNNIKNSYLLEEFVLLDLRENVLKTSKLFDDAKSEKLFEYLVQCKLRGEYPSAESGLLDIDHGYFFMPGILSTDEEVLVDVGCYTGDTIEEFTEVKGNHFEKIISFEPDKISYEKAVLNIEKVCEKYNIPSEMIALFPYGVGEKTQEGVFERFEESAGSGSKFVTGKNTGDVPAIKIVALDDFLQERISFLKADVESYEYQVIMGATRLIREYKPNLAICLYHNVFDFIQIPELIKNLVPEYKLYLRQQEESWCETILYATVKDMGE